MENDVSLWRVECSSGRVTYPYGDWHTLMESYYPYEEWCIATVSDVSLCRVTYPYRDWRISVKNNTPLWRVAYRYGERLAPIKVY